MWFARCRQLVRVLVLLLSVAPLGTASGHAAVLPAGFQETTVFSGLTQPTAVRFAADGRVFVAEKSGLIKVFSNLSASTSTIFADLRTNVHNFWDRGLLGLALAPNFPTSPYVYVLYSYDAAIGGAAPRWGTAGATYDRCAAAPGWPGDGCVVSGRLSRLQAAGSVMTGAEQVLVEDWCQQYPTHAMGSLAFGQDGALYVSASDGASSTFVDYGQKGTPTNACGDPPVAVGGAQTSPTAEGGALRSQDLRTSGDATGLDGTVLRLDPATGAALPDNPLFGGAVADDDRIVASGLRNPLRLAIRPGTNDVYVGDVGWNTAEEIDRLANPTAGALNFGWPCYEGNGANAVYQAANLNVCKNLYAAGAGAVTAPLYAYGPSDAVVTGDGCATGTSSISGLAFYTSGSYPAAYDGALFFADYARGCIWTMFKGVSGAPDPTTRATLVSGAAHPYDLQTGPNGDLFYVDLDGGTLRRIQYYSGDTPPVAVATADVTNGPTTLTVHFNGTGSSDPDPGDTIAYDWDLNGDGLFGDSASATPTFAYSAPGVYNVKLKVTDLLGASSVATLRITAGNTAPTGTILTPSAATTWGAGDTIAFSGSAVDDQALTAAAYTWTLVLDECPSTCTAHVLDVVTGVTSGSFTAPDVEYPALLEVQLTITDAGGLTDTKSVTLSPKTVALDLSSTPTGLALAVGGTTQTTPFSRTVIAGTATSLGGLSPQMLSSNSFKLSSWSDAGAGSHLTTPAAGVSLAASFTASCVDGTVSCNDANPCTTDTCDPALGCLHTPTICNDGNACTTDTCNPATGCVFTPITCNDNSVCTTDTCNPATGCVFTPITCNDNNACTSDSCNATTGCVFTPITCNDNNPCTNDSCNPATGCVFTNNTAPCNDNNVCTTTDTCQNGTCVGSGALNCDDGNVCTDDICDSQLGCLHANNSSACTDGNSCTSGDVCINAACVGGNAASGCTSCQAVATIPSQGGIFVGTPSGTSGLSGSCSSTSASPERVYQWTPTVSGQATLQTCGAATTYDTVLYLRTGACSTGGTEVACNDDTPGCGTGEPNSYHGSKITPTVTAGVTYYIVVDGYSGHNGTFSLSVTPPGTCGNNIRDGTEQCDGTDHANCASGQCTATCTCVPPANAFPDLVPAIEGLYFEYSATVATGDVIEGCAEATSGIDLMRFGVRSINNGTADWSLGDPGCPAPCDQHPLAPCANPDFICSPAQGHNHGHYGNYARYELLDANGQALVVGHKQGFCLLDSTCTPPATAKYTCSFQGLTAGCSDIYASNLGCQYLDITGLPPGPYTLRVTIDPFQKITELNENNNVVTMPVTLGSGTSGACANPTVIPPSGGSVTGTTSGTSTQGASCGGGSAPEKTFQWTPSVSGTATIQTCDTTSTNYDTVKYVRPGRCGVGPELPCNDDTVGCGIVGDGSNPRHGSKVTLNVTAGTPYYILVDGYSSLSGNFKLTVTPPAGGSTTTTVPTTTVTTTTASTTTTSTVTTTTSTTVPTTTSSSTTTTTSTVTTTTTIPGAGTCASPITVPAVGGTFAGATSGASAESGTCAVTNTSPEAVYKWVPATSGAATIDTCNTVATTFDTVVYVRTGTCSGGTEAACDDDTVGCGVAGDGANPHRGSRTTLAVTAGQTYYVFVDGYSGQSGNYSLTITPPADCNAPAVLPAAGGTFLGATAGTSTQSGTCAVTTTSPERVYQWTPSRSGVATIQTCSTSATAFDTVLYMRQGTCGTGTQIACNDDTVGCGTVGETSSPHRGSSLSPTVTAGQTYFIIVDGYNGAKGNFSLTVTPPP